MMLRKGNYRVELTQGACFEKELRLLAFDHVPMYLVIMSIYAKRRTSARLVY